MRLVALQLVAACQMTDPDPPPAAPADPTPVVTPTIAETHCMRDERQWGTTCCRTEHEHGLRRLMTCRGPQLGKTCHKKGDCDIACGCDSAYVHRDGLTGVTGHCTGYQAAGEWLCVLDEAGKVSSLIID